MNSFKFSCIFKYPFKISTNLIAFMIHEYLLKINSDKNNFLLMITKLKSSLSFPQLILDSYLINPHNFCHKLRPQRWEGGEVVSKPVSEKRYRADPKRGSQNPSFKGITPSGSDPGCSGHST